MSNLQPNTILGGRYLIQEVIGKGGMGIVYRALDQEAGGRACAVKVLKEQHSTEKSKRRFDEEIRCVLKLKSPHIVKVFATGLTSPHLGARQYVVMELVNGVPLSELLRGEALGPERAVHIALGVTSALEVAHREGVVHRDLKPANIMVDELELGGVVKILDFGIAKDLSRDETLNLTRTGMLVGTPTYMSPERFQVDEPLTPAADLYSVGLLLYHMIDGRSPIYVKHPALPPEIKRLPSPLQICWLHVNYEPPALSACPPELAKLTQALLLKEPHQRPSATQVLKELNSILERHYHLDQEPITESLPQLLFDSVLAQYTPPPIERAPAQAPAPPARRSAPIILSRGAPSPASTSGRLSAGDPVVDSNRLDARLQGVSGQPPSSAPSAIPIQTLMLEPGDMAALNQELDQIVANLEVVASAPAPYRPSPPPPFPAHPAPIITQADTSSPPRRDLHAISTLKLDSSDQSLAELKTLDAKINSQQPTPAPAPAPDPAPDPTALSSLPLGRARTPSFSITDAETEHELNLKGGASWGRWLIPLISLLIGATVSYLILTRGDLGL